LRIINKKSVVDLLYQNKKCFRFFVAPETKKAEMFSQPFFHQNDE